MIDTLTDIDLQLLQHEYNVCAAWWDQAHAIADALINDEKPAAGACKLLPWSTISTYMLFRGVGDGWDAFFESLPMPLCFAVSAAVSTCIQDALAATAAQTQQTATQYKPTDDELRDRWRKQHQLVAFGMGEWRAYSNGLWPVVDRTVVQQQVMAVLEAAKCERIRPTANLLNSVVEMAQIAVFEPAEAWDADPDLLVCANGTLHIPSNTLRAHSAGALQTTGVPYAYDPTAGCPAFLSALSRLPYRVTQFLQEFAGYCLTTDTSHEIAVWLFGSPGSGKSTIIEGFNAMLGDRAGVLSLKQVSQSRFGLSNIEGKTLIYAFESPALYLETTDILNAIVSGEAIPVERKYHDPVTVIPRAKILWAMNKLPRVGDAGDGIFRRVHIVRFDPLPPSDRDPDVKEAIKKEGPGILNWALLGLGRLRTRGAFLIPPEIRDATNEFQEGNDPEAVFVAECCDTGATYKTQSTPLYRAYKQWCFDNGHKAKSSTNVAQDWARLGYFRSRQKGVTYYLGIDVKLQFQMP